MASSTMPPINHQSLVMPAAPVSAATAAVTGTISPGAALACKCASKALKKSSVILPAAASIRREPTCAILPPTWARALYLSRVPVPSGVSATSAEPLPKPATPPWPSKLMV